MNTELYIGSIKNNLDKVLRKCASLGIDLRQ